MASYAEVSEQPCTSVSPTNKLFLINYYQIFAGDTPFSTHEPEIYDAIGDQYYYNVIDSHNTPSSDSPHEARTHSSDSHIPLPAVQDMRPQGPTAGNAAHNVQMAAESAISEPTDTHIEPTAERMVIIYVMHPTCVHLEVDGHRSVSDECSAEAAIPDISIKELSAGGSRKDQHEQRRNSV